MRTQNQYLLKMYVRAREDFQAMRKRNDNRMGRKADGSQQKSQDDRAFSPEDIMNFNGLADVAREQEKNIEKMLKKALKRFPIYNEWLKDIKGIGEVSAGVLLGYFDINVPTPSKWTQYSGMNPGLVRGKIRIPKEEYKSNMGKIVKEIVNIKTGKKDYIVQTNEMIRGDQFTKGFILPFNKDLRTHLLGVMAGGFLKTIKLKSPNPYVIEFYYPYKARLEKEKSIVENLGNKRQDDGKSWKDVSLGHRNRAALRYMVKMFLKDFYLAWRGIEGLPIRPSYDEEYLNNNRH